MTKKQHHLTFPTEILMPDPARRSILVQRYYEHHHSTKRDINAAKHDKEKLAFYKKCIVENDIKISLGIDLGCRGGALTQGLLEHGNWLGVDIDRNAINLAKERGIPCIESDISVALEFKDSSFDAVCLTEVLEHLPYPDITVNEVHRILVKSPNSVFMGSVPLDYNLRRRIQVLKGKKLSKDPTHLRSFSFIDIKSLLETYFDQVEFKAIKGPKVKHPWLSWNNFVSDIAWFAFNPKKNKAASK